MNVLLLLHRRLHLHICWFNFFQWNGKAIKWSFTLFVDHRDTANYEDHHRPDKQLCCWPIASPDKIKCVCKYLLTCVVEVLPLPVAHLMELLLLHAFSVSPRRRRRCEKWRRWLKNPIESWSICVRHVVCWSSLSIEEGDAQASEMTNKRCHLTASCWTIT